MDKRYTVFFMDGSIDDFEFEDVEIAKMCFGNASALLATPTDRPDQDVILIVSNIIKMELL